LLEAAHQDCLVLSREVCLDVLDSLLDLQQAMVDFWKIILGSHNSKALKDSCRGGGHAGA
jgi:hypothetical protein